MMKKFAVISIMLFSISTLALAEGKQAVAIYMAGVEPAGANGVHNIMGG
jgi:hypothetical protein